MAIEIAKVIQVIEVKGMIGNGTTDKPYMKTICYFTLEGEHIGSKNIPI